MNYTSVSGAIVDPLLYSDPTAYHAVMRDIRRDDPLHWCEPEGYRPFWIVSKYSDIQEVERQPDLFPNWPRSTLVSIIEEEKVRAGTGKGSTNPLKMLINMDGPEHRQHRAITQSWFMPANLKMLQADLHALATEFVDRMSALGGECDFVKDVAVWYPLRVIMTILGVPKEDDVMMLRLTQSILGSSDAELSGELSGVAARQAAIREFFGYFSVLIEERRRHPTSDLATVIANSLPDGKPIAEFEALSYFLIIATAGHDTTSATVAGGLLALLQNPDEMRKLRHRPELLASAIEEALRWTLPVTHFFRTAAEDYVLRGRSIRAGDALMMCYPSANRDEEVFEDPFDFRVDRTPNRHLAFGFGPHLCLGMNLAKLEMRTLFSELIDRTSEIGLAGPPAWVAGTLVPGLKTLPITYAMKASERRTESVAG